MCSADTGTGTRSPDVVPRLHGLLLLFVLNLLRDGLLVIEVGSRVRLVGPRTVHVVAGGPHTQIQLRLHDRIPGRNSNPRQAVLRIARVVIDRAGVLVRVVVRVRPRHGLSYGVAAQSKDQQPGRGGEGAGPGRHPPGRGRQLETTWMEL